MSDTPKNPEDLTLPAPASGSDPTLEAGLNANVEARQLEETALPTPEEVQQVVGERRAGAPWQYGYMPGNSPQAYADLLRQREAQKVPATPSAPKPGTVENPLLVNICTPIYDMIDPLTVRCMRNLQKPSTHPSSPVYGASIVSDTIAIGVDEARNTLTHDMMQFDIPKLGKVTHILWVDADMTFEPDALVRLLAHDLPIVGGLCFNRREPYQPVLLRKHHESFAVGGRRLGFVYHYRPNTLEEVEATGAAFLLIKREVFEKLGEKWWTRLRGTSEDFSFCERAKEAGYKVFVDTSVKIGHIGKVVVTEAFAKKNRTFEHEPWMPEPEMAPGEPVCHVTIPSFNQDIAVLKSAVISALAQSAPTEVCVVDDGSTNPPIDAAFEQWLAETSNGRGTLLRHTTRQTEKYMTVVDAMVAVHKALAETASAVEVETDANSDTLLIIDEAFTAIDPRVKFTRHPDDVRRKEHRILVTSFPNLNKGIAEALNTGIRHMQATSKAPYWCWLSSDDLFLPEKVERQIHIMQQMRTRASATRWQSISRDQDDMARVSPGYEWGTIRQQMEYLSQACVVNGSTVMLHRSMFDEIGFFDARYKYAQDWELFCRIGICHLWAMCPEILVSRREFGNLTEKVERSAELRRFRDGEDDRVKSAYAAYLPSYMKKVV